ncbi:MAG: METTL5 family protein [Thermoplasmatota archaeon]
MKKKQLEIFLQQVPVFQQPKVNLEQYQTPAPIAADLLFIAYGFGDIAHKTIVDLGCGTGMFAVGAMLLQAEKSIGIDVDETAISQAKRFALDHKLSIDYAVTDITMVSSSADTVIMNPPFGAQKANKHADRLFIKKALEIAPVVYSLHLSHTVAFVKKLVTALDAEISFEKTYQFSIKSMFSFHKKLIDQVETSLVRIERK